MIKLDNKFCGYTMALAVIALVAAGTFGHFAPAPTPNTPLPEVVTFYKRWGPDIKIFAFFNTVCVFLSFASYCGLSAAMRRMEPRSHMLANLQLIGGTVASAAPFLGGIILATAAVRYDAEPSVLAALNDMGVLFIELSTMPALFQGAALAAAIGADRSPDPILPRWYGYLSLTWSILAQGGVFAMFFETGPLSQNGIIGIAVPIIALFVWFVATAFVLIRIRPEQWHAADRT